MRAPGILFSTLALCLFVTSGSSARAGRGAPEGSPTAAPADAPIAVEAAGRGKPYLNLRDGRAMSVQYRGDDDLTAALRSGVAQPLALASADFDGNGTPDVVASYSIAGAGLITVQRGNPDAFAPDDDSVFARMQQGYDPASLLPVADVYATPEPPTFLATGNFDGDSAPDLVASSGRPARSRFPGPSRPSPPASFAPPMDSRTSWWASVGRAATRS
jgi:hypothetical protein